MMIIGKLTYLKASIFYLKSRGIQQVQDKLFPDQNWSVHTSDQTLLPSPQHSELRYCVARRLYVCVCVHSAAYSLGGEGNSLYPVLSSYFIFYKQSEKL